MTAITFDTLRYARSLQAAGFPDHQADVLVQMQREVLAEAMDNTFATKADIAQLRMEIAEMKVEFKAEMKIMRWMLGVGLAGIGGILTIVLKLTLHG